LILCSTAAAEETGTLRLVLGACVAEDGAHLERSRSGLMVKKAIVGEAVLLELAV
jgi:hypothetical protein